MDGHNPPLFRAEALSSQYSAHLGRVLLHQPWGYTVAAAVSGLLILLVISFAWFGTYTRKTTVSGLLVPAEGVLRLTAPGMGTLSHVNVTEGQRVEAGDRLFILPGERLSSSGGVQESIGKKLHRRLALIGGKLFQRTTMKLDAQDIEVYGQRLPLQAGMVLEADVVQDQRRMYEWALEPLYSVTRKMAH